MKAGAARLGKSLNLGTLWDIPIKMHWTFPLLFIYLFIYGWMSDMAMKEIFFLTLLTLFVFICVVFHEYGHALTARRFGIPTEDIILAPIGGVARLARIPSKASQEILVALAGPAVNVVIALLLLAVVKILSLPLLPEENYEHLVLSQAKYLPGMLIVLNIFLLIFNMLPVFPMDGGRVLRASLSYATDRVKATWWASIIGQFFALGFMFYGFFNNHWTLVFIGLFIILAARGEYRSVKMEDLLNNKTLGDVLGKLRGSTKIRNMDMPLEVQEASEPWGLPTLIPDSVPSDMNLRNAIRLFRTKQWFDEEKSISVIQGSRVVGVLSLPSDIDEYFRKSIYPKSYIIQNFLYQGRKDNKKHR